jgi:uncharacterized RDD family membrane protein YckC
MFTILGGDGQEYGPASVEQIRAWITSGRANLDTRARKPGETDWRRLGDFPEFAPAAAGVPPVMGAAGIDAQLAGLWERLGAAFVDGCLKAACSIPTVLAMIKVMQENMQGGGQPDPQAMQAMMAAAATAVPLAYPYLAALAVLQGLLVATRSQSVGKILLGLRIVRAPDGGKANFARAFLIRSGVPTMIEYIPFIGLLFWIVDTCFIFRADRRCLHDLMAGTKVIKG